MVKIDENGRENKGKRCDKFVAIEIKLKLEPLGVTHFWIPHKIISIAIFEFFQCVAIYSHICYLCNN